MTNDGFLRLAKKITDRKAGLIDAALRLGIPAKVAQDLFKDWEPERNEPKAETPIKGEGIKTGAVLGSCQALTTRRQQGERYEMNETKATREWVVREDPDTSKLGRYMVTEGSAPMGMFWEKEAAVLAAAAPDLLAALEAWAELDAAHAAGDVRQDDYEAEYKRITQAGVRAMAKARGVQVPS